MVRVVPRWSRVLVPAGAALLVLFTVRGAIGQEEAPPSRPPYPRSNSATTYRVDPNWPRKPLRFPFDALSGLAVDKDDQVYVFTRTVPPVQVFDREGHFLRSWGDEHIGMAHHIKIGPDGNVWLADIGHHQVMKFTPEGKLLFALGTKDAAGEDEDHFNQPTDMAITPAGDIFVTDGYGNNRVVHFDKNGRYVKSWGKLGVAPGEFSLPHAIAVDSKGRLYVADRNNVRIQVFDQSGKLLDVWNDRLVPWGFWVTKEDEIWAVGSSPMPWRPTDIVLGCPPKDQVFMKFDSTGRALQVWSVPKGEDGHEQPGDCNWVHCIALDSQGSIYVGDIIGKRAQKFVRAPAGTRTIANRIADPLIQRVGQFLVPGAPKKKQP